MYFIISEKIINKNNKSRLNKRAKSIARRFGWLLILVNIAQCLQPKVVSPWWLPVVHSVLHDIFWHFIAGAEIAKEASERMGTLSLHIDRVEMLAFLLVFFHHLVNCFCLFLLRWLQFHLPRCSHRFWRFFNCL